MILQWACNRNVSNKRVIINSNKRGRFLLESFLLKTEKKVIIKRAVGVLRKVVSYIKQLSANMKKNNFQSGCYALEISLRAVFREG